MPPIPLSTLDPRLFFNVSILLYPTWFKILSLFAAIAANGKWCTRQLMTRSTTTISKTVGSWHVSYKSNCERVNTGFGTAWPSPQSGIVHRSIDSSSPRTHRQ